MSMGMMDKENVNQTDLHQNSGNKDEINTTLDSQNSNMDSQNSEQEQEIICGKQYQNEQEQASASTRTSGKCAPGISAIAFSDETVLKSISENEAESVGAKKSRKIASSLSDSRYSDRTVFSGVSDGTVLRSISECDTEEWDDDPLDEYETQYFGFTPKSFMNGIYNALAEYIQDCLAAMTQHMQQQYPEVMTSEEFKKGEEAMSKYVLDKLNRSFDLLEQYMMTNILTIPDHVVLPEDQPQIENHYTEEDEKNVDLEIQNLQDKILAIRYANGVLRQDIIEMDRVQSIIDNSLKQLDTIEDIVKKSAISDIRDDTIDVVNQVKEILVKVQDLEKIK